MLGESMLSQFGYGYGYSSGYGYWESVFPQWGYELEQFVQLGQYVSPDMGMQWSPELQQALWRHVVEYRENYTDFPISAVRMLQQHRDWTQSNFTFLTADMCVFLIEVDNALRLADTMLKARPECGMSDRQMFISEATSNLTNVLSMTTSYIMSSNSYLYGIVSQSSMSQFPSLFSMAVMDMYCPMTAIKQLELNFFEAQRALLRKQLDNLSRALFWYINSGMLVTFTNQREWLLNTVQNVDTRPCSGY